MKEQHSRRNIDLGEPIGRALRDYRACSFRGGFVIKKITKSEAKQTTLASTGNDTRFASFLDRARLVYVRVFS